MSTAERTLVRPAYLYQPPRARSLARQVTQVCASVGRHLDEEQQLAVDVLTGLRPDGTPASLEAAVISARQNLKTFVLEGIALTLLLDPHNRVRLGIWSAQEFDTAQETFRNFVELFESDNYPHLHRRVKDIKRGSGKEEIELVGGRRLKFKARSGKGARGLTGDFVILDEAFALAGSHMGALLPTLSTRRRAMVFYGSSAGREDSDVLASVRDRGRAGIAGSPAYIEWCAPGSHQSPGCGQRKCTHMPGTPGCVLDQEDYWLAANPALGRRITLDYLRQERMALTPAEFARERLGWWDELVIAAQPIPLMEWDDRADRTSRIVGEKVWSIDVTPAGSRTSISVAGRREDGKVHLELIENDIGTGWAVARIVELARKHPTRRIRAGDQVKDGVILDPAGPAGELVPDLKAAGLRPYLASSQDVGQGCASLLTGTRDGTLVHLGQQQVHDGLAGAGRRDVGDGGWALSRRHSEVDISPPMSFALALQGLRLSEAAAPRAPLVERA